MLFTRIKLYRVLAAIGIMLAVDVAGYFIFGFPSLVNGNGAGFWGYTFLAAYIGCVAACLMWGASKSRYEYTLQRLRVADSAIWCCNAVVSSMYFALLWFAELAVIYVLVKVYVASPDYQLGPQGMAMIFYSSPFLHGLCPLAETGLWIRNALYVLTSGILCASIGLAQLQDKKVVYVFALVAVIIADDFSVGPGAETYVGAVAMCACAAVVTLIVFRNRKERTPNEE